MAGLPICAPRLSREQALDYGTILESLRKLFTKRESDLALSSQALSPTGSSTSKDILSMLWAGFCLANEQQRLGGKRNAFDKSYLKVKMEADIISQGHVKVKDFGARTLTFVEQHYSGAVSFLRL